jgi:hypothetical protein
MCGLRYRVLIMCHKEIFLSVGSVQGKEKRKKASRI